MKGGGRPGADCLQAKGEGGSAPALGGATCLQAVSDGGEGPSGVVGEWYGQGRGLLAS